MKKITLMLFLFLIHLSSYAQLANEGFESATFPPTGWERFNVPTSTISRWALNTYDPANSFTLPANTGTRTAQLAIDPAPNTEKWLVTTAFSMPSNAELHFFSKLATAGDQGSNIRIMISTVTTGTPVPADFTQLQTYTETTLNPVDNVWLEKVVTINGTTYPPGTQVKIAFVLINGANGGDRWLLDDVRVSELCSVPTNLAANPSGTTAILSWTSASSATTWEVYIPATPALPAPVGTTAGSVTVTGTPTYTRTGLTASTAYVYYVRAMCTDGASAWAGPFTFKTTQVPGTLPYTDTFQGTTAAITTRWSLSENTTQANKWFHNFILGNGDASSLAISNDNFTYAYVNTTSTSHAYRDIQVAATVDQVNLAFDWKNVGQNTTTNDYFTVWVVPATFTPTPGTPITVANSGGRMVGGNYGANPNWKRENLIVPAATFAGKVMRVVFEWRNDNFGTNGIPAAIDNVNLSVVTCPSPTNVVVGAVTSGNATISWTGPTSVTPTYNYYYSTSNTPPTATTTPNGSTGNTFVTISPLVSTTPYYFWVRSSCGGANGNGIWVPATVFTTAVGNDDCSGAVVMTVNGPNDCTIKSNGAFTGTNPSAAPPCSVIDAAGNTVPVINGPDIWFQFTATGSRHDISLSDFAPNGRLFYPTAGAQPNKSQSIVISLYEGTCGAVGDPLFCTINNYMQAKDLTIGKVYFVRATLNDAAPNLATTFKICVNVPAPPAGSNQSECLITTINSDFEFPNLHLADPNNTTFFQSAMQGWRTTAADNLIELWPVDGNNIGVATDADGNTTGWFAELNAESTSNLYQDYETPTQTVFKCSFAHRARSVGIDRCRLLAGPPQGPFVEVAIAETSNTAWKYYGKAPGAEITYVVPANQPVTRFKFEAVSTASGDATIGNFLDKVVFTADNSILSVSKTLLDCSPGNGTTTFVAAGSGVWTAHADNPSPTSISDPNNTTTDVTGFTTPGVYKYDWTTSYCTSTTQVTYANGSTVAPVTIPVTYCEGEVAPRLDVANPLFVLKWYAAATGGTPLAGAPTPDTSKSGTTTYYVSYIDGSCESPRTALTVTINERPDAPTPNTPTVYCVDATATAVGATADGTNTLVWYDVPVNGTALAGAPTPSTAVAGPITYYVSQITAEGCESPRVAVEVTVRAIAPAFVDFTIPATVCIASAVNPVVTPSTGFTTGGTYTYTTTGTGTITIDPVTGEIDLATSTPGSYTVTYTVVDDVPNCFKGNSESQPIVITPLTPAVVGFSYTNVCSNEANQLPQPTAAALTTGGTFTYTGTGTLVLDPATGEINIGASTTGTYTITYTVAEDGVNCIGANTDDATITITPFVAPETGFAYENAYCFGTNSATPTLAAGFSAGGVFTVSGGLTINAVTGEITNLANVPAGQYTVTYSYTGDGSVCNPDVVTPFTFTVGSESIFDITAECVNGAFTVTGSPTNGSYDPAAVTYAWTINGTSVGNDSKDFNYAEYAANNPSVRLPITVTLTVINGSCPTSQDFEITDASCEIQRGISPGNSDKNNFFDLAQLGVKKLSIFNRYGKEVYTKNNYTTEWHGQTNGGDELPTGTYFYAIDLNVGKTKTGWIYINRQN